MSKSIMLIICVLFLHNAGRAQINLVLNPNFENYSSCPDNSDEAKYCTHWMSLDSAWNPPDWAHAKHGIPDYDNVCATNPIVSLPNGVYYYHQPRSGNGMMNVQMFHYGSDTYTQARDYLQGHLVQTLIAGHNYNVCFYVSLLQVSLYAVNNIGAYLDDGMIDTTSHYGWTQYQYSPQIVDTSVFNDTLNWRKIEGYFIADGTEKLITIGNFSDSANNHTSMSISGGSSPESFYFVEDVSVIDCSNEPHAGNDTLIHASDSAWLGPHENLLPYTWYKLGSTTPIDSGSGIWVKPTVTTTYILEQKLCGVNKYDTVKVTVIPSSIMNYELLMMNVRVYPNPASSEVTIECADCFAPRNDFEVSISDITGRVVLQNLATTQRHTLDISGLGKGVYFVEVIAPATGEKVVKRLLKE